MAKGTSPKNQQTESQLSNSENTGLQGAQMAPGGLYSADSGHQQGLVQMAINYQSPYVKSVPASRDKVVQRAYGVSVSLSPKKGTQVDTKKLFIHRIQLPKGVSARPDVGYKGNAQGAHTISWILLEQAYERIPKMSVEKFIQHYLIKDWNMLRRQKAFNVLSNDPNLNLHRSMFNKLLSKYSSEYLKGLKNKKAPIATIIEQVQEAVSDLFIAIQKGPLSTHMSFRGNVHGFLDQQSGIDDEKLTLIKQQFLTRRMTRSQRKNLGIKTSERNYNQKQAEEKPSNHGEAEARGYFEAADAKKEFKSQKASAERTFQYAQSFLDLGTQPLKVFTAMQRRIVLDELYSFLARAYPTAWKTTGTVAKDKLESLYKPAKKYVDSKNPNNLNLKKVDKRNIHYAAKIDIGQADEKTAQKYHAAELKLSKVNFSRGRPPTKFGSGGQKAHTVAWTFTLKAMHNLASLGSVLELLVEMIGLWQDLESQNWNYEIGRAQKNNKANDALNISREKNRIPIWKNWCKAGLNHALKSETVWVKEIQEMLSAYMEVYQMAPLTTQQSSNPTNHSEQHTKAALDKAESEYKEGNVNMIHKGKSLDKEHVFLASKMLDINLKALRGDSNYKLDQVAGILHKWEVQMRLAYPQIWKREKNGLMAYAMNYMNHTLRFHKKQLNTFKEKMAHHHAMEGFRAARRGEKTTEEDEVNYAKGSKTYANAIQKVLQNPSLDPGSAPILKAAKEDVSRNKVLVANLRDITQAPSALAKSPGGMATYLAYYEGVTEARNSGIGNLPKTLKGIAAIGFQDYRKGTNKAMKNLYATDPFKFSSGMGLGYRDLITAFKAVLKNFNSPPKGQSKVGMMVFQDYQEGVQAAIMNPKQSRPQGKTPFLAMGFDDYVLGFKNGSGIEIKKLPKHNGSCAAFQLGRQDAKKKTEDKKSMNWEPTQNNESKGWGKWSW